MSTVQFFTELARYSTDIFLLAFVVCGLTGLIKKFMPSYLKKYLTFAPFLIGCTVYAVYMLIAEKGYNVLSSQTLLKGIECGGAATVYYVVFEQFIKNKKLPLNFANVKENVIKTMLKDIVQQENLDGVCGSIIKQTDNDFSDISRCKEICSKAVYGNTISGISSAEIDAAAALVANTVHALKLNK